MGLALPVPNVSVPSVTGTSKFTAIEVCPDADWVWLSAAAAPMALGTVGLLLQFELSLQLPAAEVPTQLGGPSDDQFDLIRRV